MTSETATSEARRLAFALSYPFPAPGGSFVYFGGGSYELLRSRGELASWEVQVGTTQVALGDIVGGGGTLASLEDMTPVIAVGSNASPIQLARKYHAHPNAIVPSLRCTIADWHVLYANQIADYGSIPATIEHAPSAQTKVIVNLLDEEMLAQMHASEDLGQYYHLQDIRREDISGLPDAVGRPAVAYRSVTGMLPFRLAEMSCTGSNLASRTQWHAQQEVIRILGEETTVEEFVRQNIADEAVRAEREQRLMERTR